MIETLHHVQIAMPAGGEDAARDFYVGILGLVEVEKPEALRGRGGIWLEAGTVRLHLGVETPFSPARKAHPAFAVTALAAMVERLERRGVESEPGGDLPGLRRVFVSDPFGNRIEFVEPTGSPRGG